MKKNYITCNIKWDTGYHGTNWKVISHSAHQSSVSFLIYAISHRGLRKIGTEFESKLDDSVNFWRIFQKSVVNFLTVPHFFKCFLRVAVHFKISIRLLWQLLNKCIGHQSNLIHWKIQLMILCNGCLGPIKQNFTCM